MRFVIAMMKHETNTFSPVPTSLGVTGSDYNRLGFQKIRRPIYPLDPDL